MRIPLLLFIPLAVSGANYGPAPLVDNLAALIARSPASALNPYVHVAGHRTNGDWGQPRLAQWIPSGAAATNLGCVFNATGGQWVFPDGNDGVVKPEWFGAIGDGVTPSSAGIQNIIDDLRYKTIEFGNGTWLIDQTLIVQRRMNWRGETRAFAAFRSWNFPTRLLSAPGLNAPIFRSTTASGEEERSIEGICFDGSRSNQTSFAGIALVECAGGHGHLSTILDNVCIMNSATNGLYILQNSLVLQNSFVAWNDGDGILLNDGDDAATIIMGDTMFDHVYVGFNKGWGINARRSWVNRIFSVDVFQNNLGGIRMKNCAYWRIYNIESNSNGGHNLQFLESARWLNFYGCLFSDANLQLFNNYPPEDPTPEMTNSAPSGTYDSVHIDVGCNLQSVSFDGTQFQIGPGEGFYGRTKEGYQLNDARTTPGLELQLLSPSFYNSTNAYEYGTIGGAITNAGVVLNINFLNETETHPTMAFGNWVQNYRTDHLRMILHHDLNPPLELILHTNTLVGPRMGFLRSRSDTMDTYGPLQYGDYLGRTWYSAYFNTNGNWFTPNSFDVIAATTNWGPTDMRAWTFIQGAEDGGTSMSTNARPQLVIKDSGRIHLPYRTNEPTYILEPGDLYFHSTKGLKQYRAGSWETLIPEAPTNGIAYARSNETWVAASTGGSEILFNGTPVVNPNIVDDIDGFLQVSALSVTNLYYHHIWNKLTGFLITNMLTAGANITIDKSSGTNAVIAGITSTNSGTVVSVDGGSPLVIGNFADSSELNPTASGSNITYAIVSNSIATNKIDTTFYTLLTRAAGSGTNIFVNGALVSLANLTNNLGTNGIVWVVSGSDITAYATNTAASGTTYSFTNGVTNAAGIVQLAVAAGANITLTTNNGLVTFAATTGGTNSGTALSVDGAAVLSIANLADSAELNPSASGSNITYAIVANSIATNKIDTTFYNLLVATNAIGTDTWGVYVAGTPITNANLISSANATVSTAAGTNVTYTFTGVGSATNGYLFKSVTQVSVSNTVSESSLYTWTIPANTLSEDGDELEFYIPAKYQTYNGQTVGYEYEFAIDNGTGSEENINGIFANAISTTSSANPMYWDVRVKRMSETTAVLMMKHVAGALGNGPTLTNNSITATRYLEHTMNVGWNDDVPFELRVTLGDANTSHGIVTFGNTVVKIGSVGGSGDFVLKGGDTMTGALSNQVSIGAPILIAGTTNVADALALKQPLDADLTALAAGTVMATLITNSASLGSPAIYLGTTNLAGALALKAPLASPVFTGTLTLPQSDDPDVSAAGHLSWDTDGWLRAWDGANQVAVGRKIVQIDATVYKPQDLDDAQRDALWIWSNQSGMSFIVTGWAAWSTSDDTDLTITEMAADGTSIVTVDAVSIATNGTGIFYGSDTTITSATIANGHIIYLNFDDTDAPAQVKITIYGYYDANVN